MPAWDQDDCGSFFSRNTSDDEEKKSFATLAPAGEDLPRHGGQGPGGGRGLGAEPAPVKAQPGPG